jgi:hypothetical protein
MNVANVSSLITHRRFVINSMGVFLNTCERTYKYELQKLTLCDLSVLPSSLLSHCIITETKNRPGFRD